MVPFATMSILLLTGYGTSNPHCKDDEEKLCGQSSKLHQETKTNCMHEQIDKITNKICKEEYSKSIKSWLEKKQSFESVKKACTDVVKKKCPDDLDSRKNFKVCLMMNQDDLTAACKKNLNMHIKNHLPGLKEIP